MMPTPYKKGGKMKAVLSGYTGRMEAYNMFMYLLGNKDLDFVSNGERVKGTQLFVSYPEDGVTGQRTDKLFFKDGFELPNLQPGMTLDIVFNHRGKPERVTVASNSQRINLSKQQ